MMLIANESHREHLSFLRMCSPEEIVDLFDGVPAIINKKKKITEIGKNNDSVSIENTLDALVYLTVQSFDPFVTAADFFSSLKNIGFSKELSSIIWNCTLKIKPFLINIFGDSKTTQMKFRYLEWRLETKIFSRSIFYKFSPIVTMKMYFNKDSQSQNGAIVCEKKLQKANNTKEVIMQIDLNKIRYIINVLEEALFSVNRQNIPQL